MKKLLIITNLFWVCVIVLPSFVQPGNLAPTGLNSTYHLIDASLVKQMAESYRDNYVYTYFKKSTSVVDRTNGVSNNEDSRTIWFSKEQLIQFINDMDVEAGKSLPGASVSGIRFYYIKYPDAPNWSNYLYLKENVVPVYKKRHSLMLVPTYLDSNTGYHTDFDPRRYDNVAQKFKDMPTVMDELITAEATPIPAARISAYNTLVNELPKKPSTLPPITTFNANATIFSKNTNTPGVNPMSLSKAAMFSADDSGTDPSITNSGSIIPPFGVNGVGASALMMKKSVGVANTTQLTDVNTIDVPCSGAKLMLYVDGFQKCGIQKRTPIKKTGLSN